MIVNDLNSAVQLFLPIMRIFCFVLVDLLTPEKLFFFFAIKMESFYMI